VRIEQAFRSYIEEDLPKQHHLAMTALDKIMRETWRLYEREHPFFLSSFITNFSDKVPCS